jgi:superfamily II DNA or RNA helicase
MKPYFDSTYKIPKDSVSRGKITRDLRVIGKGRGDAPVIVDCFKDLGEYWEVPVPYGIEMYGTGVEVDATTQDDEYIWPAFKNFSGRNDQDQLLEKVVPFMQENLNCRVECPTGYGKSVVAIRIAQLLKANALVVVHNTAILKQFEQNAKEIFDIECGWFHGKKDERDAPITLTTVQTLASRLDKMDDDFYRNWKMAVWDEAHRSGAPSYVKVMRKMITKYKLGVSATWRRPDRLDGVFKNYLGEVAYRGKITGSKLTRRVYIPTVETKLTIRDFMDYAGQISKAKIDTKIGEDVSYNNFLTRMIKYLAETLDRRMVVTSNRISQLDILADMLSESDLEHTVGVFAGSHKGVKLKDADFQEAFKQDIVLASTSKIREGLDVARFVGEEAYSSMRPLDTIIIASPTPDPEQIAGRIGRYHEGVDPLVIQPCLDMGFCRGRIKRSFDIFYKPQKYQVLKDITKLEK